MRIIYIIFLLIGIAFNSFGQTEWNAKKLKDINCELGEGAFWDYQNQRLLFIDIERGQLIIYFPQTELFEYHNMGRKIGTVVPISKQKSVVALRDGIYVYEFMTKHFEKIVAPDKMPITNRFNDGKCDKMGRLWAGTMDIETKSNKGKLYKIDGKKNCESVIDNVSISNGINWSLDNKIMYYIDTPTRQIVSYDYDFRFGTIKNKKVVVNIPEDYGFPDGMTIDSEGKLWVAMWGGSKVTRWDPSNGKLIGIVNVPAKNITSIAFGGKNLNRLYITSASKGVKEIDKENYKDNGDLFYVDLPIKGINLPFFKY